MKNEKSLLNIQTKCGDIANKILNAAIFAERTFKCKWPYDDESDVSYTGKKTGRKNSELLW